MSHSNASTFNFSRNTNQINAEAKHRRVKSTNDFEFLKLKNLENQMMHSSDRPEFLLYSSQTVASGFFPRRLNTEDKSGSSASAQSIKQLDQSYQLEDAENIQSHSRSKVDSSEGKLEGVGPFSTAHPLLQQQNTKSPTSDDGKRLIIEYLDDVNPPQREFLFGSRRMNQMAMGFLGAPSDSFAQASSFSKNLMSSPKMKETSKWKPPNECEIAEEDEDYRSNHPSLGNIPYMEVKKTLRAPAGGLNNESGRKLDSGSKRLVFIDKIFSKKKELDVAFPDNMRYREPNLIEENKGEEMSTVHQSDDSANHQQGGLQIKVPEVKMISQKQEKMERLKRERGLKGSKIPNLEPQEATYLSTREVGNVPSSAPQVSINGVPKRVEVTLKNDKKQGSWKETTEYLTKQRMNNNLVKQSEELNSKIQNYITKMSKKSKESPANPSVAHHNSEKKLQTTDSSKAPQNIPSKPNRGKTISNPTLLHFLNQHQLSDPVKQKTNQDKEPRARVAGMNTISLTSSAVGLNIADNPLDGFNEQEKRGLAFHLVSPGGNKINNGKKTFSNATFQESVQINLLKRIDRLEEDVGSLKNSLKSIEENGRTFQREIEQIRADARESRELHVINFTSIERSLEKHGEWLKNLDKFVCRFQEHFERISFDRNDSYQNEISTSDSHYELLKPNPHGFSNLASKIKFQEEMSQNITPRVDSINRAKAEKRK